ncbi:MAG: hypothetical protein ACI9SE_004092, partial [Neolewinella sp.]
PTIAESRLRLLPDGRVAYSLKKRWKDGTTHVVLTACYLEIGSRFPPGSYDRCSRADNRPIWPPISH